MKKAMLALADGTIYKGYALGAIGTTVGEVVFNTGMTGYQEIITDPSYHEQIVNMTYPLIGNYGVNTEDVESAKIRVAGFVVKEASAIRSNWRSEICLDEYLQQNNIVGLQGIDTRALTKHIRDVGAQQGAISSEILDQEKLIDMAKQSPGLIGRDLVCEVTCREKYHWHEPLWETDIAYDRPVAASSRTYRVAAYDYGIKYNILRNLVSHGCSVTVFPADTPAEEVLADDPDGIFLSNGPGDPTGVPYAIENIKKLIEKKPVFGICLGHQLLCLALGFETFKLKFGHRGSNHPVMELANKKVEITSQNHGFAVKLEEIADAELTHLNLNDNTVEGIQRKNKFFSVQYHPEASPGPHDSNYLFTRFSELMDNFSN
jgi:carbamoyl-phosphate synthase small subunit